MKGLVPVLVLDRSDLGLEEEYHLVDQAIVGLESVAVVAQE